MINDLLKSDVGNGNVVPGGGFEPPTRGFSVLCSCTNLRRHIKDLTKIILPLTKNGSSRWVPLTKKAIEILNQVPQTTDQVFPITDVALRQSWERLRNRANLIDFTFHDLRHEAISRMFEKGLNVPEVASISGHKAASQLFRYVQVNVRL